MVKLSSLLSATANILQLDKKIMFGFILKRNKLLNDSKLLGRWGEKRCEKFLKNKGMKTLARNYSCRMGEIDLVMVDRDGTIVFVEVKARADEKFAAVESAVDYPKQKKLALTGRFFLSTNNISNRVCRFDVVTLLLAQKGPAQLHHYQRAFVPE